MDERLKAGPRSKLGRISIGLVALVAAGAVAPLATTSASASTTSDWGSYLFTIGHSSDNVADTAVTKANAGTLTEAWNFTPPGVQQFITSPTVVGGVVYIGANNGNFYALDQSTGAVIWSRDIGTNGPKTTCGSRGFASTATVADDPVTSTETVYVAASTGYLFAFNAATGATIWQSVVGIPSTTVNNYFNWGAPQVANGKVYMGISSMCDQPLVQGGLIAVNQETGARVATYYTVPAGAANYGGSVWSSPAIGPNGDVYITTGNGPASNPLLGTSESIVDLNGSTLKLKQSWQIPAAQAKNVDSDFGASPTLFTAILPGTTTPTNMIGACNKNGYYYALNRGDLAAGPVWSIKMGASPSAKTKSDECIGAAVFNGKDLFFGSQPTTIDGTAYNGSIRELNPATGAVIWATGLPGDVDSPASMDGAGVISVATYDFSGAPNADYLVNATTGAILATLSTGNSQVGSQPVFAENDVLVATQFAGLYDYRLPA
jgi:outer membrane protein assembly factor BamB